MKLVRKPDEITPELIYSKIDDYDIYRYYMGEFKIGVAMCNHHRGDRNPSLVIYLGQSGHLFHRDYADERFRGGPFDLIVQLYPGINYDGALKKVATDFGISDALSQEYKKITSQYIKPTIDMKKHAFIQMSARKWEKADLEYWAAYGISLEDLRREEIYCIKEWFLNRRRQFIRPGELCFGYRYNEGFKIYYPTRTKDEGKWTTNITTAHVENLSALKSASKVLIVKSKKDRLVLQNVLGNVAILSVQNESKACFTEEFVNTLKNKDIWVSYDSDAAGKKASLIVTQEFGYKHINVPDLYLSDNIKDWADLYKKYNSVPILNHFKEKGFLEKTE
jgi:5S rRNA maturation endonuclease (ribonuclease M5)